MDFDKFLDDNIKKEEENNNQEIAETLTELKNFLEKTKSKKIRG